MSSHKPYNDAVEPDLFAYFSRKTIHEHLKRLTSTLPSGDKRSGEPMKHGKIPKSHLKGSDSKVGIIGGGIGGLYTAMILEDLGIPYEILEATPRIGGRLFTHRFQNNPGQFQYYDVGAMRFPQIPLMRRLFNLFETLGLDPELIPYHFAPQADNSFLMYNTIRTRTDVLVPGEDTFDFGALGVGENYIRIGANRIVDVVVEPFYTGLLNDLNNGGNAGWNAMMAQDHHSTRSFMSVTFNDVITPLPQVPPPNPPILPIPAQPIPTNTVNWLETMDKSSGWYNRGFTETVLEGMAFGAGAGPVPWFCIPGGSWNLAQRCSETLQPNRIIRNTAVAAVTAGANQETLDVRDTNGVVRNYSHVVSTVPLRCLRTMNLAGLPITAHQRAAIRQLQYGPSIKIGIQFNRAWWTLDNNLAGNPINLVGGQSFTDYPVRTVVYPSYGLPQNLNGDNAVLIASYCWTDDADFWGSLIADFNPLNPINDPLTQLVLRDLATVHNVDLAILTASALDVFPWDWSSSRFSMGAFAFFGPGQFQTLYPELTIPDQTGRFHFAGEAISARHAWVVGALDSAWRAVFEILILSPTWGHLLPAFLAAWGFNQDWIDPPGDGPPGDGPPGDGPPVVAPGQNLQLLNLFINLPDLFDIDP